LEESGSPLESFKVHNANCENNYVLDFKVKPLGGPLYQFILNLTLIYLTLNLNLSLTLIYLLLTNDGYDGGHYGPKESGQGSWRKRKMAQNKS